MKRAVNLINILKKLDKCDTFAEVGVFEGGGYVAKGVYRPAYDCLMKTFDGNKFCAACSEAIQKMIDFYSE